MNGAESREQSIYSVHKYTLLSTAVCSELDRQAKDTLDTEKRRLLEYRDLELARLKQSLELERSAQLEQLRYVLFTPFTHLFTVQLHAFSVHCSLFSWAAFMHVRLRLHTRSPSRSTFSSFPLTWTGFKLASASSRDPNLCCVDCSSATVFAYSEWPTRTLTKYLFSTFDVDDSTPLLISE